MANAYPRYCGDGPEARAVSSKKALDTIRYFHYIGNMKTVEAVVALSALAQDTRLEIYRRLVRQGPDGLPAGEIARALSIPPATLSFHLAQLDHAGLVVARRAGRSIVYAANYDVMRQLLEFLTACCCEATPDKVSRGRSRSMKKG
jgi:ArsR family transcriptional regulator